MLCTVGSLSTFSMLFYHKLIQISFILSGMRKLFAISQNIQNSRVPIDSRCLWVKSSQIFQRPPNIHDLLPVEHTEGVILFTCQISLTHMKCKVVAYWLSITTIFTWIQDEIFSPHSVLGVILELSACWGGGGEGRWQAGRQLLCLWSQAEDRDGAGARARARAGVGAVAPLPIASVPCHFCHPLTLPLSWSQGWGWNHNNHCYLVDGGWMLHAPGLELHVFLAPGWSVTRARAESKWW